jgi:hypothetical protein
METFQRPKLPSPWLCGIVLALLCIAAGTIVASLIAVLTAWM